MNQTTSRNTLNPSIYRKYMKTMDNNIVVNNRKQSVINAITKKRSKLTKTHTFVTTQQGTAVENDKKEINSTGPLKRSNTYFGSRSNLSTNPMYKLSYLLDNTIDIFNPRLRMKKRQHSVPNINFANTRSKNLFSRQKLSQYSMISKKYEDNEWSFGELSPEKYEHKDNTIINIERKEFAQTQPIILKTHRASTSINYLDLLNKCNNHIKSRFVNGVYKSRKESAYDRMSKLISDFTVDVENQSEMSKFQQEIRKQREKEESPKIFYNQNLVLPEGLLKHINRLKLQEKDKKIGKKIQIIQKHKSMPKIGNPIKENLSPPKVTLDYHIESLRSRNFTLTDKKRGGSGVKTMTYIKADREAERGNNNMETQNIVNTQMHLVEKNISSMETTQNTQHNAITSEKLKVMYIYNIYIYIYSLNISSGK